MVVGDGQRHDSDCLCGDWLDGAEGDGCDDGGGCADDGLCKDAKVDLAILEGGGFGGSWRSWGEKHFIETVNIW